MRLFDRTSHRTAQETELKRFPLLLLITSLLRLHCHSLALDLLHMLCTAEGAAGLSLDFVLVYCGDLRSAMIDCALYGLQGLQTNLRPHLFGLSSAAPSSVTSSKSNSNGAKGALQASSLVLQPLEDLDALPQYLDRVLSPLSCHLSGHLSSQLSGHSSCHLSSPALYACLCSLLRAYVERHLGKLLRSASEDDSNAATTAGNNITVIRRTITYLSQLLLASLSCAGAEATFLSAQLWRALSLLPYAQRFAIYDSYRVCGLRRGGTLAVQVSEALASKDVKAELKRLTKDNPKAVALKLAKTLQANSIVSATCFLQMIAQFDNLIPYAVDALRTLTDLARDVFAHALLQQLQDKEAERSSASGRQGGDKGGGLTYPNWFAALARFIASFYARYPAVELRGLLFYLLQSLGVDRVCDLLLVKELLLGMGGCDSLVDVSLPQLEGLSGGRVLRSEVMSTSSTTTPASASSTSSASSLATMQRKAAAALRDAVVSAQVALPLLLFVARLRDSFLFDASIAHLKLVSQLSDAAQELVAQLTDFLVAEAKSFESISRSLPNLHALLNELELSPQTAFQLVRPLYRHHLLGSAPSQATVPGGAQGGARTATSYSWQLFSAPTCSALVHYLDRRHQTQLQQLTADEAVDEEAVDVAEDHALVEAEDSEGRLRKLKRERQLGDLWWRSTPSLTTSEEGPSPRLRLYLWFWGLGLSDIYHPSERYASELKRLRTQLQVIETQKSRASGISLNMTQAEFKKWQRARDSEMQPLQTAIKALEDESAQQLKHVQHVKDMLCVHRLSFFNSASSKPADEGEIKEAEGSSEQAVKEEVVDEDVCDWILQELLLPRILLSATDAVFCVKFLRLLHDCGVLGVHLLVLFDALLDRLVPLLFCATEAEAACLGHAVRELLACVSRWRTSLSLYDAELKVRLTACTASNTASSTASGSTTTADEVRQAGSSYTKYLALCKRWHSSLLSSLLQLLGCKSQKKHLDNKSLKGKKSEEVEDTYEGSDFIYLRCGLVFLSKIASHFPCSHSEGDRLLRHIDRIREAESRREDLQVMAKSVGVLLRRQSATWIDDKGQSQGSQRVNKEGGSAIAREHSSNASKSSSLLPKSSSQRDLQSSSNTSTTVSKPASTTKPPAASSTSTAASTATSRPPAQSKETSSKDTSSMSSNKRKLSDTASAASSSNTASASSSNKVARRSDSREREYSSSTGNGSNQTNPAPRPPPPASAPPSSASNTAATQKSTKETATRDQGRDQGRDRSRDTSRDPRDASRDAGSRDTGVRDATRDTGNRDAARDSTASNRDSMNSRDANKDRTRERSRTRDLPPPPPPRASSATTSTSASASHSQHAHNQPQRSSNNPHNHSNHGASADRFTAPQLSLPPAPSLSTSSHTPSRPATNDSRRTSDSRRDDLPPQSQQQLQQQRGQKRERDSSTSNTSSNAPSNTPSNTGRGGSQPTPPPHPQGGGQSSAPRPLPLAKSLVDNNNNNNSSSNSNNGSGNRQRSQPPPPPSNPPPQHHQHHHDQRDHRSGYHQDSSNGNNNNSSGNNQLPPNKRYRRA